MQNQDRQSKLEKLRLLEEKEKRQECLPHLYGFKLLPFQKLWIECVKYFSLLFAGNQLGKSSANIIKAITWATDKSLWPKLWETKPLVFWYMYPDAKTATSEIENKWIPEFLPKGEYKDHETYGWKVKKRQGHISEIVFNSGVTIQIKYYSQGQVNLQGASIWALFADEEIPWSIVGEIRLRLIAKGGYFHLVCTPTLGQQEWARTIEPEYLGTAEELFKDTEIDILKLQVSMYDCTEYADGSPSHITLDRIKQIETTLNDREIQVRVYGRFMMESGLLYENFDEAHNVQAWHPLPSNNWLYYAGIDLGGGGSSHESGIVVTAVNKHYTKAKVVYSWISKGELTTCGDVLDRYRKDILKRFFITRCFYDFSAKDFGTLAERAGVPVEKANKDRILGIPLINTLFKCQSMMVMHDLNNTGDSFKLISELKHLMADTKKRFADDTLVDAMRYSINSLRFSMDEILAYRPDIDKELFIKKVEKNKKKQRKNHRGYEPQEFKEQLSIITEMEEWSDFNEY